MISDSDFCISHSTPHCLNNLEFLHITVLLLVLFKGKCAQTDICSKSGLLPGIARDRGTFPKGKSLILNEVGPSACGDWMGCKSICFGWNYVEVRVVSHLRALFSNIGYGKDCHVRMFHHFKSIIHSILIVCSLCLHQGGYICDGV